MPKTWPHHSARNGKARGSPQNRGPSSPNAMPGQRRENHNTGPGRAAEINPLWPLRARIGNGTRTGRVLARGGYEMLREAAE
jgi:hypothetical protein